MQSTIYWSIAVAVVLLIATAIAAGLMLLYLPANYFTRSKRNQNDRHPLIHWSLLILKNLAGVVLIIAGLFMLVLPGQGVLTIILGLLLLSFPGKKKLVAELIRRTSSLSAINGWRQRFHKPPLQLPL